MKEIIRVGDEHYILATTAHDERTRVLKHGNTFALFDRSGNVRDVGPRNQGIFHEGTRFLSRQELRICGLRPLLLSSSVVEDNALLAVDLTNPDIDRSGGSIPHGTLHLFRAKVLGEGTCQERVKLHNYGLTAVTIELSVELDADFRDIFEVRGTQRRRRPPAPEVRPEKDGVTFVYLGLDGVRRTTRVDCSPRPTRVAGGEVTFELRLAPGENWTLYLTTDCAIDRAPRPQPSYDDACAHLSRELEALEEQACRVTTSNGVFNGWLERSIADLRMMITHTPAGPYPYAGVPWYSTVFGRDGLITALQALWFHPDLAKGVLRFLASSQATEHDAERDAEPGKIVHELRRGEMAALGEIPFGRYYGTVDATPLFVMLAGEHFRATGERDLVEELWPSLERALEWMSAHGDLDGDGLLEYARRSARGLGNQGWKDSFDSVFHADGRLAEGPIALCEVQGYAYAALNHAARLAAALGKTERACELSGAADRLRLRFEESYWVEELSTYALALDGEKRPCRVKSSNPGHCLFTGISSHGRAHRVARTLMSPEFFTGWGIRTIGEREARYNPMAYHNGSVWPHDNAIAAAGFARYGLKEHALEVFQALYEASLYFDLQRVPELFCGFVRRPGEGPTLYPVACLPQAWAAGSVLMLLSACLGLEPDGVAGQLRFIEPMLPPFLDHVRIERLRVGDAVLDIEVHRYPEGAGINVLRRSRPVQVTVVK